MLVKDTRNALELQIIQNFNEVYLLSLQHQTLGYINVIPEQMLTYLKDAYDQVANEDIIVLKIQLTTPYSAATTLNNYFNKIKDIQEMSASGAIPLSDTELLAQGYVNIKYRHLCYQYGKNGRTRSYITRHG